MLGGGAVLVVAALALGEGGDLDRTASRAGLVRRLGLPRGLRLASSASRAYAWLLGNAPISQVVTHQYVNPLVAIALGALVLGEPPEAATLVGAALIVTAPSS